MKKRFFCIILSLSMSLSMALFMMPATALEAEPAGETDAASEDDTVETMYNDVDGVGQYVAATPWMSRAVKTARPSEPASRAATAISPFTTRLSR